MRFLFSALFFLVFIASIVLTSLNHRSNSVFFAQPEAPSAIESHEKIWDPKNIREKEIVHQLTLKQEQIFCLLSQWPKENFITTVRLEPYGVSVEGWSEDLVNKDLILVKGFCNYEEISVQISKQGKSKTEYLAVFWY